MFYVYILKSQNHPRQTYVGYSTRPRERLEEHNRGKCPHTSKFMPWDLAWYCGFPEKMKAIAFETYLKSHSGKAFTNKRLL